MGGGILSYGLPPFSIGLFVTPLSTIGLELFLPRLALLKRSAARENRFESELSVSERPRLCVYMWETDDVRRRSRVGGIGGGSSIELEFIVDEDKMVGVLLFGIMGIGSSSITISMTPEPEETPEIPEPDDTPDTMELVFAFGLYNGAGGGGGGRAKCCSCGRRGGAGGGGGGGGIRSWFG